MKLEFTKMQGLGNDFVVIDATRHPINLDESQARYIADRRYGIGCDQILLLQECLDSEADFTYQIINHDGSDAHQCLNGARCMALFVREHGLCSNHTVRLKTSGGLLRLRYLRDNAVSVEIARPTFVPHEIPFICATGERPPYQIHLQDTEIAIYVVSLGNPHAVLFVEDIDTAAVHDIGTELQSHPHFPEKINAGFMQIVSRQQINLRVFERGVGETLACGSGACAAVVCGIIADRLDTQVCVTLPGGELEVNWEDENSTVILTGPAKKVYTGSIQIND